MSRLVTSITKHALHIILLQYEALPLLECEDQGSQGPPGADKNPPQLELCDLAQPSCSWDGEATVKQYAESEPCYYEGGQAVYRSS